MVVDTTALVMVVMVTEGLITMVMATVLVVMAMVVDIMAIADHPITIRIILLQLGQVLPTKIFIMVPEEEGQELHQVLLQEAAEANLLLLM